MKNITFKIYSSTLTLPEKWNEVAASNHFLQTPYLQVLEKSAPVNMECFYIGIFENETLIGTLLSQYLDLNKLESFGERDNYFKKQLRNFIFKNFASHVLFLGNNMITGQNAYALSKEIEHKYLSKLLIDCGNELILYFKKKKIKIHIVSVKDFYENNATEFKKYSFKGLYEFNVQPNMIFYLDEKWKSEEDYIAALSKKYRDQFKRARKKNDGIIVKNLSFEEVVQHENTIYDLYHYVAKNATFNTFFLAKNHFSTLKGQCGNRFQIFGYFLNDKLVGFHTLLLNDETLETYFLGYDETIQKENMLYLNMLYNMTKYGIENGFKKIIFGRTALEIKSSVGATPVKMSGFIYHNNKIINKYIGKIFKQLEPELHWQQRHPFK
ncbi:MULTISPECIES: GNAT family N-acetyltransferase [unclassified Flavobacterium]|uniref:GNAT family N-acetyltransferase n=1 Tax=unclassified Flavobacterium TaxID=196869 RepID=UPI001291D208|nr:MULTISPECIES: GNAT family N-acetyltransferase [unclassified Flavobacterium]MQP51929.1 GNAT family N-acetyltransferase [Flavobacterium sp. LMO9]MQP61798.1 GNAT family N-acetyltransferase [Flavobacterium sp. LMO6]